MSLPWQHSTAPERNIRRRLSRLWDGQLQQSSSGMISILERAGLHDVCDNTLQLLFTLTLFTSYWATSETSLHNDCTFFLFSHGALGHRAVFQICSAHSRSLFLLGSDFIAFTFFLQPGQEISTVAIAMKDDFHFVRPGVDQWRPATEIYHIASQTAGRKRMEHRTRRTGNWRSL
jgi:hypothetical protein